MDQARPTTSKFEREIWRRPFTVECAWKPRGNLNRGRIQGHHPIFLPDSSPFTRKLVHRSHVDTTRRSGPYHDQSARAILGTAFKSTRRKRSQGVFRLQAVSGYGTGKTASWTPIHWLHRGGAPHLRLSELILQGPSSTVSEPKQKERPILHCTRAVLPEDYSWKYYQAWKPVNS